jgi:diacylglycerol kinase (ATP)
MTYFTIVNPAAGGGRCGRRVDAALAQIESKGISLDVHRTARAGDATELARRAWADGFRSFLAVGGDGTTYEVINGLFPHEGEERPRLAMLPLGTGNSFLRDFKIQGADGALAAITRGRARRCDVVRATHSRGSVHYVNLLSVGFTAIAGELTNRRFKRLGPAGYILATLATAARLSYPVFSIHVDQRARDDRPCILLSFSNSRFTGGTMMMAPEADATDGALDVIRIGRMSKSLFVRTFPSIFAGTHVQRPEIEQERARSVVFELDREVDVMVDGEIERMKLERLDVLPGVLEVVA